MLIMFSLQIYKTLLFAPFTATRFAMHFAIKYALYQALKQKTQLHKLFHQAYT